MDADVLDFSALPDVSELHPELAPEERWFAAHMKAREDAYLYLFGESEPPGQILSPSDPQLTVSWPGGGIYQYPPREGRPAWHYVTHGLAQPFSEEEGKAGATVAEAVSGLGVEYVISTAEPAEWAPNLLLDLVRYLLFTEGATAFGPGERIPYSGFEALATPEQPCRLTQLLAVTSAEYPAQLRLPGGFCTLIHFVGVTEDEVTRARNAGRDGFGSFILANVLIELGIGLTTVPARECATEHPLFDDVWAEVEEKMRSTES
jgi:hypothetical protein